MYQVRLQEFEGPLDLLLFFIQRDELDIRDIPIARIADEYLGFVRLIEEIDLDSAGDFVYMAAQLISLKARMLLPRPPASDDDEESDPRRDLVERLLDYVRYREAAQQLSVRHEARRDEFTRGQAASEGAGEEVEVSYRASVFDLVRALHRVLREAPEPPSHEVVAEAYSQEAQQDFLLSRLSGARRLSFASMVLGRPRGFVIATFLAVLELARQGRLRIQLDLAGFDFHLKAVAERPPVDFPA